MPRATTTNTITAGAPPAVAKPTTPKALDTRYEPAVPPVPTTITRPGKTRRSPAIVTEGRILGTMFVGRDVHHYRVAGADGVLYFAPPKWLPPDPRASAIRQLQQEQLDRQWAEFVRGFKPRLPA